MTDTRIERAGSGDTTTIAYFVTDHGYGHATRAAAVMGALSREDPGIRFEIFTTAPQWLFQDRQPFQYRYHRLKTDVGLVQSSPLRVDLEATVRELGKTLPFDPGQVAETAAFLKEVDARMIICDIAPIGIDIAAKSGVPSVLVENFTWDLNIPPSKAMVLLSMGGLADRCRFPPSLPDIPDTVFVLPGGSKTLPESEKLIMLPPRTEHRHPDLVSAADVVIGKLGYSTVAEVFQAGVVFGYLIREDFRESAVLADFVERNIPSIRLEPEPFFQAAGRKTCPTFSRCRGGSGSVRMEPSRRAAASSAS